MKTAFLTIDVDLLIVAERAHAVTGRPLLPHERGSQEHMDLIQEGMRLLADEVRAGIDAGLHHG